MTIAYCSDTHVDMYLPTNPSDLEGAVSRYITNVLRPPDADCLIIAGDIGHYNHQNIELLKQLKQFYPEVLIVTGNHDLYLVSNSQQSKYNYDSFQRLSEFRQMCLDNGIHYLDGTSVTINDVTIGGCPMWYDLPTDTDKLHWVNSMNDSRLIMQGKPYRQHYAYGYSEVDPTFDTQSYYLGQVAKLKQLSNLDVFVSHVIPIIRPPELVDPRYRNSDFNIFYESDNIEALKATGAHTAIFGHTHITADFKFEDTRFLANAIGYPHEAIPSTIATFEVQPC